MNWIYETPSVKEYGITSVVANGNQRLNDWVCKHGIGGSPFGRACGQIINADTTIQDPDTDKIFPAKRADFNQTCPFFCDGFGVSIGDSGGPVAYAGALFGIVSTTNGKYTTARNAETDLDVWFCLNSSCSLP